MKNSYRKNIAVCLAAIGMAGSALAQGTPMSLVIGIDGLGFGTHGFSGSSTPNMDALINGTWQAGYNGGYSDLAFTGGYVGTVTEQGTASGQGWSTILTGVWNNDHGAGSSIGSTSGFNTHNVYFETLEENVSNLYSSSVINWPTINNALNTVNDGNSSMDRQQTADTVSTNLVESEIRNTEVRDKIIAEIAGLDANRPAALFAALTVDGPGHTWGSGDSRYGAYVELQDEHVGDILNAIASRSTFADEDWQIVITSDHGHRDGGGHGGQSFLERTIPLIIASQNVDQVDLDDAVGHGGIPVSQADVAPTALEHFGLAIPSNYVGESRAGDRLVGDLNRDGFVGIEDLDILLANWGSVPAYRSGDLTGDGEVGQADLDLVVGNWGGGTPPASNIPEPGSLVMLGLSGWLIARRRRA